MTSLSNPTRRKLILQSSAIAIGSICPRVTFAKQGILTPQDFGAIGDGQADDSLAISGWLDAVIDQDATGMIPAGDYLLGSMISKTLTKISRFGLTGMGSNVSRFIVPASNTDGAFDIDGFQSRSHQVVLSGFAILVEGHSNIGFRLIQPEGGAQHQRSITLSDVWARSADKRTNHFVTAFDLTGCWRPRLQNCGWDGPFVGVDDSDSSARFLCETGFNLDGCYGLSVEDCYAWGCVTGISSKQFIGEISGFSASPLGGVRVSVENPPLPFANDARIMISGGSRYDGDYHITRISADSFDIDARFAGDDQGRCSMMLGPEGMNFKDNTINGVKNGIWIERPNGREPTCWINGNHINFRDYGVILDGVKIIQADQNNTYNEDRDRSFDGVPRDLDLRNASEYIISGHVFHFDGHPDRIGIHVDSDTPGEGDNGLIHHCIFSGQFATAIHLSRKTNGVRIGPNLYPGKIGNQVKDLGENNLIIR